MGVLRPSWRRKHAKTSLEDEISDLEAEVRRIRDKTSRPSPWCSPWNCRYSHIPDDKSAGVDDVSWSSPAWVSGDDYTMEFWETALMPTSDSVMCMTTGFGQCRQLWKRSYVYKKQHSCTTVVQQLLLGLCNSRHALLFQHQSEWDPERPSQHDFWFKNISQNL